MQNHCAYNVASSNGFGVSVVLNPDNTLTVIVNDRPDAVWITMKRSQARMLLDELNERLAETPRRNPITPTPGKTELHLDTENL